MARIIRTRQTPAASPKDTQEALELLHTIAETEQVIAEQTAIRTAQIEELRAKFDKLGKKPLSVVTPYGTYVAEMVTPMGRASKTIDVVAFRKKVGNDKDFMECVKVIAERAEKVLSGKELESVTTETPGEKKDPVFVVGPKKESRRGAKKE